MCESLSTLATTTICVQRRTECVAPTCLTECVSQIVLHRVCGTKCVAPTCLTHPGKSPPSTGGARRDVVLNCPALHCTTMYHIVPAHCTKLVYTSQHGQAWELCSVCEVAGVLRLNYQLLGASYADEPYVGGMGGLQRRGEEEKLRREKNGF